MRKHIPVPNAAALVAVGITLAVAAAAETTPKPTPPPAGASASTPKGGTPSASAKETAPADSMTLRGGETGTVFDDMTIQGEDRIRIEFDRPPLDLAIDPKSAPGLTWDRSVEVLDRTAPSAVDPLLAGTTGAPCPYLIHPTISILTQGPVVRFTPKVESVERWTLGVADSRGQTVATFRGNGKVPKEIPWDGTTEGGAPALPGLVYSYVFEAHDRAGNKRNFMGDGFEVRPYIRRGAGGMMVLFTGLEMTGTTPMGKTPVGPMPVILETAGWLNQLEATAPVKVEARARTFDQAKTLADRVVTALRPLILGDPSRLAAVTSVEADAPETGSIMVSTGL